MNDNPWLVVYESEWTGRPEDDPLYGYFHQHADHYAGDVDDPDNRFYRAIVDRYPTEAAARESADLCNAVLFGGDIPEGDDI